jgi:hypothetical protein
MTTYWRRLLLRGRPRDVSSQAPDLHKRKLGITPFDCPCDNEPARQKRGLTRAGLKLPRGPDHETDFWPESDPLRPQEAGPRRSLEMNQMSGSVDSTLRLLDLAERVASRS